MPKFSVSKSIIIQAPIDQVYQCVRDFKQWPKWSPWLISDQKCRVDYAKDGSGYGWEGPVAGSGAMVITDEQTDRQIDYQLNFLKPWKSEAQVRMAFESYDGGTKVTWSLDSALPFFMFWMKPMMIALIGMDYERGLKMLKDLLEKGSVESLLDIEGITPISSFNYVAVKTSCSIDEIAPAMKRDFGKLEEAINSGAIQPSNTPISITHKWDPVNGKVEYSAAVPVATNPDSLLEGFVSGTIPDHNAYVVRHTGRYDHLANAWATGMSHARAGIFKQDKAVPPFEIYVNSPDEVPPEELITAVHIPAK